MKILLVEGDSAQAETIEKILRSSGRGVLRVHDGERAVQTLKTERVALVVLDWCLQGMSGLEVLRWIRAHLGDEPTVLFLTARTLEADVVAALEAGADEYIAKPCRESELAARIKALLRRIDRDEKRVSVKRIGAYVWSPTTRTVTMHGSPIDLTEKEFALMSCLFDNVGQVMSRDLLGKLAWGRALDGTSRSLDTHIYRLRQKLALRPENGVRLSAVYTHGYRLDEIDGAAMKVASPHSEQEMPADDIAAMGAAVSREIRHAASVRDAASVR
ncbi:response regulator transcription factor [Burkholderia pseudomultivorans]|uniref:Sensory transduction protein regX3 n=1 Tax=Burkholderia pseudomultivorans TaxID=1207504 RepID=A0ABU2E3I4_9BURK|nr:response regulator transcription factor [Burkholderia pseudomultivorans]MDR8732127.1 Sensory transduction protein regX3 [Burkholderia pseudomultivorans]MDR8737057.1 Sensory transduction protein regX3 [Burkholderia pseudomultivorans]MDR8743048.1 Sensory transduction protein regX3 [Burkholderia pseudomultivorans]MDR8754422.1 Sensory transduction protein regX3 [Burkholderia pseudomultivorans]MDR8779775.1 Sensory transduction protein regX3 [Burkholderia pseudomultivorans]